MKKTLFSWLAAFMLLTLACGQEPDNSPKNYGPVYVNMNINGNPALHVAADSPLDQSATVSAKITSRAITASGETIAKNTLIVGASVIIDQASAKIKTLNFSVPDVTAPGTYKLVEKGGLFVYSDASGGMSNMLGYTIMEAEDGSCTVTINQIGGEPIPTAGKAVKGSFTATVKDGEITYRLKGSFNGGVPE